jgi:hypothetical protein
VGRPGPRSKIAAHAAVAGKASRAATATMPAACGNTLSKRVAARSRAAISESRRTLIAEIAHAGRAPSDWGHPGPGLGRPDP